MEGVATDEHFLAGTMELLRRCDAVIVCSNWSDSEGARAEVAEACRLGKPVLYAWENIDLCDDILRDLSDNHKLPQDGWGRAQELGPLLLGKDFYMGRYRT